jgi:hypothetical protein
MIHLYMFDDYFVMIALNSRNLFALLIDIVVVLPLAQMFLVLRDLGGNGVACSLMISS